MGPGRWTATLTVAANLMAGVAAAGDGAQKATVAIRLDDLAQTPVRNLERSKAELERIFQAAGIAVEWADSLSMPGPGRVMLILVNTTQPATGDAGDIVGEAALQVGRAYVYCNRLEAMTRHSPADAPVILGRVMAHEVGHLLLPPNSHSRVGIMRPYVDFSQASFHSFTRDQVQAMHRFLR